MMPLVSVIVPVGTGHEKLLPYAIESIRRQTLPQDLIQVVVVNDTGKLLTPSGVKLYETKGKQGSAIARNLAIERARTPLIVFLDADDLLLPTALETMVRAFASYEDASYIYGDSWTDSGDGKPMLYYNAPLYDRDALFKKNIHNITALLPTSVVRQIGGFDEVTRGWEDWDFYIRLGIAGHCGVKVPSPLILYRLNTGGNRAYSGSIGYELFSEEQARYKDYIEGRRQPMGCCGSDKAAKEAARMMSDLFQPTSNGSDSVLMEFLGQNLGSIPFRVNGNVYRGANTPQERFVRVKKADVGGLLATQTWRLVPESATAATKPELPDVVQARRREQATGVTVPMMQQASVLAAQTTVLGCANKDFPRCNHLVNFHGLEGCQALIGDTVCGCLKFIAPMSEPIENVKSEDAESNDQRTRARPRASRRNARAISSAT